MLDDTFFCFAPGMPLNVMSSFPLLLVFAVKRGHRAVMLRKFLFLLYGVKSVNYDISCALFREVQSFVISTNRSSMASV